MAVIVNLHNGFNLVDDIVFLDKLRAGNVSGNFLAAFTAKLPVSNKAARITVLMKSVFIAL
jgi:hypothetical protein